MAGGRDPWRGADRPRQAERYGAQSQRRDGGSRTGFGPPPARRRQPPPNGRHAAGGGYGRGADPGPGQGPGYGAGPEQFDSRSVFVGADGQVAPSPPAPHSPPGGGHSVFVDPIADPHRQPHFDDGWDVEEPPKRRRNWKQRLVLGTGVVLVMSCLAGVLVAGWVLRTYNSIDRFHDVESLKQVAKGEPENYLIIGSDSRDGENGQYGAAGGHRSDTIMVVRIDPKSTAAYALSFPRDLQVRIAGTGSGTRKINSAYAGENSDPSKLVDTLSENFGIPIHHIVEIDFAGFKKLIDEVGGVDLWMQYAVRNNPNDPEHDVGLNITKLGCVNVGSEQALALARSRVLQYRAPDGWKNDPYGDYGRITRQQVIIKQALKKAAKQAKSSPVSLKNMAELASDTVKLDNTLTISDLMRLGKRFQNFDPNGLKTYSIPVYTKDEAGKGDPYPDMVKAEPILNGFRGLPLNEVGPSLVNLKVRNGSGQEGQAMNVAGAFQKIGFKVQVEPGAEPEPLARTTLYYAPGQAAFGQRVARHLTAGAELQERSDLRAGEVVLVTGTDFSTVHEEPVPLDQLNTTTTATPAAGAGDTGSTASTTATTAKPPAKTTPTTAPQTATTTPQVGYAAGQPPPGKTCG